MEIHPVGILLHADRKDGRTDRHYEADSRLSQFCERAETGALFGLHYVVT
jgi:hypothetical protein